MRWNQTFFRLCASVAMTAFLAESIMPVSALAQQAPPPAPPLPAAGSDAGAPAQNQVDPPSRVGRVAMIQGTASFHDQGDTQWSALSANFPVSTGNAFWTQPNSSANLEISDSLVALSSSTEFDVHSLDPSGMQGVAAQGEVYLDLRNLAPNEAWVVQTPRGLVKFNGSGRYGIVVGSTDDPTVVTVINGSASVESTDLNLTVQANQAASLTGTGPYQGSVVPAERDAFLTHMLQQDNPPPPARLPTQVAETISAMPGGYDMASVGSWSDAPEYGQVWYPPVDQGWVPYRHGHWAYVAPWGWTWIDDASWGFAPFHYGRWVEVGGRWGWTPGVYERHEPPVYAPALVAFVGLGVGVAIGAALASGNVGWVPLGPREPYRPWYHASDNYVRQVNYGHVTNVTNINNITINNYANRGAATVMPAAAMAASRPVAGAGRPMTAQQFSAATPVFGQQPLRPTAATAGVTPAVAQRLNIAPAVGGRPIAPGPAIRPASVGGPAAGLHGPSGAPGPAIRTEGRAAGPLGATAGRPVLPGSPPGASGAPVGGPNAHPGAVTPGALAPGAAAVPHVNGPPGAEPHGNGPAAVPRVGGPAGGPAAVEPHVNGPGGEPHMGAPAVMPHVNAPAEAPHVNAPAVVPHVNAPAAEPRVAPQVVAPRVAPQAVQPHVAAPAPQPHFAPAPVQPHIAAPAPAPHVAAPTPQPHFNPPPVQHAAPPPAPRPAAAPAPHPAAPPPHEKRPGER